MSNKPVRELLTKDTLAVMKENNFKVKYNHKGKSEKVKYSKVKHLEFFRGYDFLENVIVARPYIQKKYNLDICLFELLLFLSPKQFFTQKDYAQMPKQYKYCSIKDLLNTGYISVIQSGSSLDRHLYRVNRKGSEIVRHFYEILSGEKKMDETYGNPLARKKTRTAFDKKKMDLITQINQLPAPEGKKPLYL